MATPTDYAVRAFAASIADLSRIAADDEEEFAENADDLGGCLALALFQIGLHERVREEMRDHDEATVDGWWAAAEAWKPEYSPAIRERPIETVAP